MTGSSEINTKTQNSIRENILLSACAELTINAENEKDFIRPLCQRLAELGGYQLIWIGYQSETDTVFRLHPAAKAGPALHYLEKIGAVKNPGKLTPSEHAFKNINHFVINDLNTSPHYEPWAGLARHQQLAACAALPMINSETRKSFAAIAFYSEKKDFFTEAELHILKKISSFIASIIQKFRLQKSNSILSQKLGEAEARIETAMEIVSDGLWEWTFNVNNPKIEESNFKILEQASGKKHSYRSWRELINIEDLDVFIQLAKKFVKGQEKYLDFLSICDGRNILLRAMRQSGSNDIYSISGTFEDISALMEYNELKEELEFRQMLINTIPISISFKNTRLNYIGCNMAFELQTGFEKKDIIGKNAFDIYPHKEAAEETVLEKKLLQTGGTKSRERTVITASGKKSIFVETMTVFYKSDGTPGGIINSSIDITENREAEQELRKSRERYKTVSEFSTEMIYWLDNNNFIQYISPYCKELTDYTAEEFYENPSLLDRIIDPEDSSVWKEHIASFNEKGDDSPCEIRIRTKDANTKWVRHMCMAIKDSSGKYLGRRGSYTDISILMKLEEELINARDKLKEKVAEATSELSHTNTQLKKEIKHRTQIEESLRISEKSFRDIAETSPVALCIISPGTDKILFANSYAHKLFLVQDNDISLISPEFFYESLVDKQILYKTLSQTEKIENYEVKMKKTDGSSFYASMSAVHGIYQETNAIYVGITDITERKMFEKHLATTIKEFQREIIARRGAENALRERENKYKLLFENMTNAFGLHEIICNDEGHPVDYRFLEVNPGFEKITGLKASDIIGKRVLEIIPSLEKSWIRIYGKVALSGTPYSFENYNRSLDKHFSVFAFNAGKNQFATIFSDITERKKMEDALRTSEYQYRKLTETAQVGIWQLSHEGKCKFVNQKMCEMLEIDSLDDIKDESYFNFVPPNTIEMIKQEHDKLSNGFMSNYEAKLISKKGNELDVIVSGVAIFSNKGQFQSYIETFTDITDRKKAEKETELQRLQLIQADKMVSLGIIVAGVAHEINNPANFIMLNAPILKDAWNSILPILDDYMKTNGDFTVAGLNYTEIKEFIPSLFSGIMDGTERIKNIVSGLKDYAREDKTALNEKVNVNNIVNSAMTLLANMIKKSTNNLLLNLADELPPVKGNSQRLEQVVINLVQNACQALPDRHKSLKISSSFKNGKIIIEIADEGIGISEKDLPHILDPFFTTKRDSGGTGLGLSISLGIIKDIKGELKIESEYGKGTRAAVLLDPWKDEIQEQ